MLASEMSWVRRYLIRVVTQQLKSSGQTLDEEPDADAPPSNEGSGSLHEVNETVVPSRAAVGDTNFDFGNPMVSALLQAQVMQSMSSHGGMVYEPAEVDTEAESAIVELEGDGDESNHSDNVEDDLIPAERVEDDASDVSEGAP